MLVFTATTLISYLPTDRRQKRLICHFSRGGEENPKPKNIELNVHNELVLTREFCLWFAARIAKFRIVCGEGSSTEISELWQRSKLRHIGRNIRVQGPKTGSAEGVAD